MRRSPDRPPGRAGPARRGTVASCASVGGYGFIEPADGGGELLVRARNIEPGLPLRVGEEVLYSPAAGSFASEAVDVRRAPTDTRECF
jgi:cold shock CspA family protein